MAKRRACPTCGRSFTREPFGDACADCQYDDMCGACENVADEHRPLCDQHGQEG